MQSSAAQAALALGPIEIVCSICGQIHEISSSILAAPWMDYLAICGVYGMQYADSISNITDIRQTMRNLINDLDAAHTCFMRATGAEPFYNDIAFLIGQAVTDAIQRHDAYSFVPTLENLRTDLEILLYSTPCERYVTDGNYGDNDLFNIYTAFNKFGFPQWLEPWVLIVSPHEAKTVIAQYRIQQFVSHYLWTEGDIIDECNLLISDVHHLPWVLGDEHPLPPPCESAFMSCINRIIPACKDLVAGYRKLVQTAEGFV